MFRLLYEGYYIIRRGIRKLFIEPIIRKAFGSCGKNVRVLSGCKFEGIGNVRVGNSVTLGENLRVLATRAGLIIGDHVMIAPDVTIVTGDHRTDLLGVYMDQVKDGDKRSVDDQDVIIENDVWIGAKVTVLKGVTIGRGSILAAGSVVTKDVPAYSVAGGIPATVLKCRFTEQEIEQHERMIG